MIAEVADCGVEQAKLAADNAQRGFESWRKTTPFERAALLAAIETALAKAARIGRDQLVDYAGRAGLSVQEAERWLAPNLD